MHSLHFVVHVIRYLEKFFLDNFECVVDEKSVCVNFRTDN